MHTFNLGLVFGAAKNVVIIVCASEQPIDKMKVNAVATKYFQQANSYCQNLREVLDVIKDGIERECGCQAVIVSADVACMIPFKS